MASSTAFASSWFNSAISAARFLAKSALSGQRLTIALQAAHLCLYLVFRLGELEERAAILHQAWIGCPSRLASRPGGSRPATGLGRWGRRGHSRRLERRLKEIGPRGLRLVDRLAASAGSRP